MKYISRPLAVLLLFILTFLPIVVILITSVWQEGHITLKLFNDAFSDKFVWMSLRSSAVLAGLTSLFAAVLAIPCAWFSARTDAPLGRMFPYVAFIPLLVPSQTLVYAWMQLMIVLGETGKPLMKFYNAPFCIFVMVLYYFPVIFYGAYAAFKTADTLSEKTAFLYHRPLRVWVRVVLPAAAPLILASFAFTLLLCFTEYSIPALLTVPSFIGQVFANISSTNDIDGSVVISMTAFIFAAIGGWFIFKRLPLGFFFSESRVTSEVRYSLSKFKYAATALLGLVFALSALFPILILLVRAFSLSGDPYSIEESYFSGLKYFREAIAVARKDIQATIMTTTATAMCSVIIALPIARLIVTAGRRAMYSLFVLLAFSFLLPGTVFAVGMIRIYNIPGLDYIYTTQAIIFFTHVGRFLPLAILILAGGMLRVGTKREFVARLHGVSDIKAYFNVYLPSLFFEFWLAFLAVLVFSMAELGATTLVSFAGPTTLTNSLYIMMHYGNEEQVSALVLIQVAIIFIPIMMFSLLYFPNRRRSVTNA